MPMTAHYQRFGELDVPITVTARNTLATVGLAEVSESLFDQTNTVAPVAIEPVPIASVPEFRTVPLLINRSVAT